MDETNLAQEELDDSPSNVTTSQNVAKRIREKRHQQPDYITGELLDTVTTP